MIDVHLFEQVADAVRSMMPEDQASLQLRAHRRGLKAWFDAAKAPREHYEAQVIARRHVDGKEGMAIEVGFHSEHKEVERNEQVIRHLLEHEKKWRKPLGEEAEAGTFLGADAWRRLSEVWMEPDLEDPELAFEMAARLVDYLDALEPVLSRNGPSS